MEILYPSASMISSISIFAFTIVLFFILFVLYKEKKTGVIMMYTFLAILSLCISLLVIQDYLEKRHSSKMIEEIASIQVDSMRTVEKILDCGESFKFIPVKGFFSVKTTRPIDFVQGESSDTIEHTDRKIWVVAPAFEVEVKQSKNCKGPTAIKVNY